MKILHVIPTIQNLTGGPYSALIGYANCLKGRADVEMATTEEGLTEEGLQDFRSAAQGVFLHHFPQWGSHSTNFSWPLTKWLGKNIKDYDIIHLHALFSPMTTIAAFLARREGVPYVVRPLGTLSPYTFSSGRYLLKRSYFNVIEKKTLQGASATQFTSPLEMEKAQGFCKSPNPVVIPNPVEPVSEKFLSNWRNENPSKKILFMSRIHPKKGLDLLIRAVKNILPRYGMELIIAGTGQPGYVEAMRRLTDSQGLGSRVHFLGFLEGEKKLKIMKESLLLALPSHDENFGMAVSEAMAIGLPVLVSDQVGIWPDIQEYGAGVVVRCEVDSIKEGLEKLLENPMLAGEMGKLGKQLVQERYSPEKVGSRLLELYTGILSTHTHWQNA